VRDWAKQHAGASRTHIFSLLRILNDAPGLVARSRNDRPIYDHIVDDGVCETLTGLKRCGIYRVVRLNDDRRIFRNMRRYGLRYAKCKHRDQKPRS
jgi:hypothetical protein